MESRDDRGLGASGRKGDGEWTMIVRRVCKTHSWFREHHFKKVVEWLRLD